MKKYIAVDIGGTVIKYGIVDASGRVLFDDETETKASQGQGALSDRVQALIDRLFSECPEAEGIGISTAGIVDEKSGSILYANSNMPGYAGMQWKETLEKKYNVGVKVNNDVNCAALAEAWVGAAKNTDDFLCITIGTGIGGSIFVNGRLYTGGHSRAAEIGYMNTSESGDSFEKSASTSALVKLMERRADTSGLNGKIIFKRARENDPLYTEGISEWIDNLCLGIANMIFMFDPSLIVIGGGVSNEGDFLIDRIIKGLEKTLPDKSFLNDLAIKPAACHNHAGMIGSVYGFVH